VLVRTGMAAFSVWQPLDAHPIYVLVRTGMAAFSVWQPLDAHPIYKALFEATARHLGAATSDLAVAFSLGKADELQSLFADAGFEQAAIHPRSLVVRFASPEHFVSLTVAGAATSVPAFIQMSAETRTELIAAVAGELAPVIEGHVVDGELMFQMSTHVVVAS
ncbi:hypothetical protein H7I58_04540, partial [Mycolicibacterium moriokaense]